MDKMKGCLGHNQLPALSLLFEKGKVKIFCQKGLIFWVLWHNKELNKENKNISSKGKPAIGPKF